MNLEAVNSALAATVRKQEEEIKAADAEIKRLRAELETANANCDRMAALAIDNAKDTLRLRAVLKEMVHQFERNGMTRWPIYHAARAALTAQPAAPEERRTGLRLVMVAATLLDQEDLPDEPSAILCGSIDAIRSLGGLLGDPVDVLPAQPAAPGGE